MSTLDDMHRAFRIKTWATQLTSAAETKTKAEMTQDAVAEVEPDNVALSSTAVMILVADHVMNFCFERLQAENALDGIETMDGAIVRAYLLAGERHPDHRSLWESLVGG